VSVSLASAQQTQAQVRIGTVCICEPNTVERELSSLDVKQDNRNGLENKQETFFFFCFQPDPLDH
jgi:hypothetical protein